MKQILVLVMLSISVFGLSVGSKPSSVSISEKNGGLVAGGPWKSEMLRDKVYVLFYIDPDEKSVNEHFSKALKEQEYDHSLFGSMAIVNLGATWKPNFVIEKILKSKQKEFPDTIYAKDKNKILVDAWDVEDDASNILIFAKDGTLLFYKSGKMQDADMRQAFSIIKSNL